MTIDDVIFSMYVLSDPTYDGSSTFYAVPIEGMEEYRSGMDTLINLTSWPPARTTPTSPTDRGAADRFLDASGLR